jgi:hypothetical protein
MNMNQTIKKSFSPEKKKNASINNDSLLSPSVINQKNQKPVYLFYRTPSNKDNKKIEFNK